MLIDDPGIFDRHVPSPEGNHPGIERTMPRVERSLFERAGGRLGHRQSGQNRVWAESTVLNNGQTSRYYAAHRGSRSGWHVAAGQANTAGSPCIRPSPDVGFPATFGYTSPTISSSPVRAPMS